MRSSCAYLSRRTLVAGFAAAAATSSGLGAAQTVNQRLYVPPEEAPHARTFMQWPASRGVYRDGEFLAWVQETIAEVASTIAEFEPVTLLAHPDQFSKIRRMVSQDVELWDIPTEDLWARDSGPLFAIQQDGSLAVSHIQFNGWGNKQIHQRDGQIAANIAERLDIPLIDSGVVGEAGGIEHDGHGLLFAHESSWVIENRNPNLSRAEIEQRLLAAYGAERCIWAPGLKNEDITDYHIDSLARFTGPGRVLMNLPDEPDPLDPFHNTALVTHDIAVNEGLEVEVIPEPVRRRVQSDEFVASYVNYYVCNDAVIAAQFGDQETDAIARDALSRHYSGREIVMLNADALGEIGGGIHCATQQMPRV
ncbi:MAG: agmatine deiminase family protein [Pseudomonadota bacterium]